MAKKQFTRHNYTVPSGATVLSEQADQTLKRDDTSDTRDQVNTPPTILKEEGSGVNNAPITASLMAPVEDIFDSKYQTREGRMSPEKFNRLVTSMKEAGPQDVIKVRKHPKFPGKWQIAGGGHNRRDAAKAAGLLEYPIAVVDYDDETSALAIGRENLAREDLTPLEEGNYYLSLKQEFGYTQEQTAAKLGVNRDHVKECIALAKSAPHILNMMHRIKEHDGGQGDPKRGLRAAKCLRRLDILDERSPGLAKALSEPLINHFIVGQLYTDDIDKITDQLTKTDDPEKVLQEFLRDLQRKLAAEEEAQLPSEQEKKPKTIPSPEMQRTKYISSAERGFENYWKSLGDSSPSETERERLQQWRQRIDEVLSR